MTIIVCQYCCQPLPDVHAGWCPTCRSRLQPISLLPGMQLLIRLCARLLDLLIFHALVLACLMPCWWIDLNSMLLNAYLLLWVLLADTFGYWIYESWLLSCWGATPGKWLLRLSVADPQGQFPTFKQALSRIRQLYNRLGYTSLFTVGAIDLLLDLLHLNQWTRLLWLLALFTAMGLHVSAWRQVRRQQGLSPWDDKVGLRLSHKVLRFERVMVAVVTLMMVQAATSYLEQWPQQQQKVARYF